jgi:hypothetical protein
MGRYLRWEAREGPRATWRESLQSFRNSLVLGTYRDTIVLVAEARSVPNTQLLSATGFLPHRRPSALMRCRANCKATLVLDRENYWRHELGLIQLSI